MIPAKFDYHAPSSLSDAIKLLSTLDDAKLLAGGHSLLPMMKLRFAEPENLIDIHGLAELKGIVENKNVIEIGAMTTENELIASALLDQRCPLIAEVARWIADPQVRNRGTIGGDIAHGDPGNDHPAAMLALNAEFVLEGPDGERRVAADDFFLGTYMTALAENELLTRIRVPARAKKQGYGFHKLKRKTGDFATAAAAVALTLATSLLGRDKGIKDIRIALTNVGPTAFRAREAEDLLRGQTPDDTAIEQAAQRVMAACAPTGDLRGDADYKSHMAALMFKRALKDALKTAAAH